jgi:hypothetical protein
VLLSIDSDPLLPCASISDRYDVTPAELVVDRVPHAGLLDCREHLAPFGDAGRKWLFAQDVAPRGGRGQHDLVVQSAGDRDTDDVQVDLAEHGPIVVREPADACLAGHALGVLAPSADHRNNLEVVGCLERWNVDRGAEAGADNADPHWAA